MSKQKSEASTVAQSAISAATSTLPITQAHSNESQRSSQNLQEQQQQQQEQEPDNGLSEETKESQLEQRQTSTDQSNEISIGNKTAEELVGDILTSDPMDDDIDAMLSRNISKMADAAKHDDLHQLAPSDALHYGDNLRSSLMLRHE